MPTEIRRLHSHDAAAYREVRLRAFTEHPDAFTTSAGEFAAQPLAASAQRLSREDVTVWGAFDDGVLRGTIALEREQRLKTRHKAKVTGMYVAPECAGAGAGKRLMEALVAHARGLGLELLVLTVTRGNDGAVRLYERCGFHTFGVEARAIKLGPRAYDKIHMALDLREPF